MITTNTAPGVVHAVDTKCPPCTGNCNQGRQCAARLQFAPGVVERHKRPPMWKRALAALGVRL